MENKWKEENKTRNERIENKVEKNRASMTEMWTTTEILSVVLRTLFSRLFPCILFFSCCQRVCFIYNYCIVDRILTVLIIYACYTRKLFVRVVSAVEFCQIKKKYVHARVNGCFLSSSAVSLMCINPDGSPALSTNSSKLSKHYQHYNYLKVYICIFIVSSGIGTHH